VSYWTVLDEDLAVVVEAASVFTATAQRSLVNSIRDHLRRFFVDAETERVRMCGS